MARHITEMKIKTYRGIKDLSIPDLRDVNILVGDNNAGKTSVLEAIQILCNPCEYNIIQVARQREKYKSVIRMGMNMNMNILDSVLYLFNVYSSNKEYNEYEINLFGTINGESGEIRISGEVVNQLVDLKDIAMFNPIAKNKLSDEIIETQQEIPILVGNIFSSFSESGQVKMFADGSKKFEISEYTRILRTNRQTPIIETRNIQTIDHIVENAFSNIIKNKEMKKRAVELLKEFDEEIVDIRYINDEQRYVPVIENKSSSEYIPLSMYGDGMKKALTMLNAIVSCENGIVLIDEFETALHISAMKKVFQFVINIAKQLNVQLFLTTHSIEALDKLLESSSEDLNNISVIRLKKKQGKTISKVTNGEDAMSERKIYNMELRI